MDINWRHASSICSPAAIRRESRDDISASLRKGKRRGINLALFFGVLRELIVDDRTNLSCDRPMICLFHGHKPDTSWELQSAMYNYLINYYLRELFLIGAHFCRAIIHRDVLRSIKSHRCISREAFPSADLNDGTQRRISLSSILPVRRTHTLDCLLARDPVAGTYRPDGGSRLTKSWTSLVAAPSRALKLNELGRSSSRKLRDRFKFGEASVAQRTDQTVAKDVACMRRRKISLEI